MEMSENDETISGSDLAIMKTEPGDMDQKYFQNSHFITEMTSHLYSRTARENLNWDQQKVYFCCFTSSLMAVTEIFTANKNETNSVSIKEMEHSEGQMSSDQAHPDDQDFFSSIELW